MWQSSGLQAPPAVVAAVQEYRTDMDSLGQWIDEFCTISGGLWSSTSDLYQSYVQWAKSSGYKVLAKRTFSNRLQERGFTSKKSGHLNTRGWDGICLKVDTSTMFDGTSDTE
jgi:phage/plasmid-associated DNA primase